MDAPEVVNDGPPDPQDEKPTIEKPKKRYKAEKITDLDEAFLHGSVFSPISNSIRTVITETSMGNEGDGGFDIFSASIATNTALELARRLKEEQKKIYAARERVQRLLNLSYVAHCAGQNQDPNQRELPGDDHNFAMYDVPETIFFPTYIVLDAYLRVLVEPESVPRYTPGIYGAYEPLADRSKMSNRDRHREDKIVLCELLSDFILHTLGSRHARIVDEFSRGICKEATEPRMREIFGQGYLEKENQLTFLMGYIFQLISQNETLAREIGIRVRRPVFRTATREPVGDSSGGEQGLLVTNTRHLDRLSCGPFTMSTLKSNRREKRWREAISFIPIPTL